MSVVRLKQSSRSLLPIVPLRAAAAARAFASVALLDVNTAGVVHFATEKALLLLAKYFPGQPPHLLPATLLRWLQEADSGSAGSCEPRVIERDEGLLVARPLGRWDTHVQLFLEEKLHATVAARLAALGLTPREAEVLLWIAKGKTGSDIAAILGCKASTVAKHTERILAKLHVETRTAAAAAAMHALS